jgi:hypothetical protein
MEKVIIDFNSVNDMAYAPLTDGKIVYAFDYNIATISEPNKSTVHFIKVSLTDDIITFWRVPWSVSGPHNIRNVMLAYCIEYVKRRLISGKLTTNESIEISKDDCNYNPIDFSSFTEEVEIDDSLYLSLFSL